MFRRFLPIFIIAMFMLMNQAYSQQLVDQGLVAYWSFDKSSIAGDNVRDIKNGHDGVIAGEPQLVNGKVRDALSLNDGRSGDNIVITDAPDLHTTQELTICLWINFRGTSAPNNWPCIMRKGHSDGANYFFGLWDTTNQIYMTFTPPWQDKQSGLNVKQNDWSYVALRVNGADAKVSFYVDGKTSEKALGFNELPDTNSDIMIGGGVAADPADLNAAIDELCLYDRFLSDGEIEQNESATQGLAVNGSEKIESAWGYIKNCR